MSRNRNWCFTLQASSEEEHVTWAAPGCPCPLGKWMDDGSILYLVCQLEKPNADCNPHLQGYLQLKNPKGLGGMKKLSAAAHWEPRRGTHEQARDYCKKSESRVNGPWELGNEKNEQGKRNDWALVSEKIAQGCTRKQVLLDQPHLAPCAKGVDALIEAHLPDPPLQRDIKVFYLYGPTGTGKTHRAYTTFPQAFKIKGKYFEGKSFDKYEAQKVLILDEWDPQEWSLTLMNSLLDKWECSLQCRYFNKYAYWETVVICTNFKPEECYPAVFKLQRDSFLRRLTNIVEIKTKDDPVVDFGLGQAATTSTTSAVDSNGSPLIYDADAWDEMQASQPMARTQPWPGQAPVRDEDLVDPDLNLLDD